MTQEYRKYPRTLHLPWSPGVADDDRVLHCTDCFAGCEVVVLEKMDGENTTLYRDHVHARSIESAHHPSRTQVKRLHARLAHEIPEGWRICGENMQARHSIAYTDLPDWFLVFSIWDASNRALSWDETLEWCQLLGLSTVPELFRGQWDAQWLHALQVDTEVMEGYVVRLADGFAFENFQESVAKWVRAGHVQTDDHWLHGEMIENGVRGDA